MSNLALALTGCAILSWVLSFPFYGPLAPVFLGSNAVYGTHAFALGLGMGFFLSLIKPATRALAAPAVPVIGALIAASATVEIAPFWCALLLFVAGLTTASTILRWTHLLASAERPLIPFSAAAIGAHLWCVLSESLLSQLGSFLPGLVAITVALVVAHLYVGSLRFQRARNQAVWPILWPLLLFMVMASAVGGLMYRALTPALSAWPHLETMGYWPYIAGLVIAAPLAYWRYQVVGAVSLSLLGAALLPVSITAWHAPELPYAVGYVGTLMGLAFCDVFIWIGLINLARTGAPNALALGLGVNVTVVFCTGLMFDLVRIGSVFSLSSVAFATTGLLFFLIPVIVPRLAPYSSRTIEKNPYSRDCARIPGALPGKTRVHCGCFSPAEERVLRLVLDGKKNGEIAQALFISPNTVKFHMKNILRKAGCSSRQDLALRIPARWTPDHTG